MPPDTDGFEIATNWTVVRTEEHLKTQIIINYFYLCADCMIRFQPRQAVLITTPPTLPKPAPSIETREDTVK
jgi:hypothetical protein